MIRTAAASEGYLTGYIAASAGTYLDEAQYMPPVHGGKMASYFGFGKEYDREAFLMSIQGKYKINGKPPYVDTRYHASGEKVLSTGEVEKTDAAIEVVISPPKSFSIAIEFAKGKEKEQLQNLLSRAMDEALERMEELARARVTTDGVTRQIGVKGLSWTRFAHNNTRRGDMDMHAHVIINKQAVCDDGVIRTVDLASVIRIQYELDAYLKSSLARQAAKAGYKVRMTENGPELELISSQLIKAFSSGREEIMAYLEERGIDAERAMESARDWANHQTRLGKVVFDPEHVQKVYVNKAASVGVDLAKLEIKPDTQAYELRPDNKARDALLMALADIHEREDVIKSRHVLHLKAMTYAGFGVTGDDLNGEIDHMLATGELVHREKQKNGRATAGSLKLTSRMAIQRERAAVGYYRAGKELGGPITISQTAQEAIEEVEAQITEQIRAKSPNAPAARLTKGQVDMVHSALGLSHNNRLIAVEGDPGSGKTTGMEAVRIAATKAGYKVRGLAPSDQAREALTSSGIETETIQLATKSEKFWDDFDARTLLILDEAGMVDSRSMNHVLEQCQARGVRVVLVGDSKQLQSVEAGTPFARIVQAAKSDGTLVEMSEMTRGRTDEMRAMHVLSRDDQAAAIARIMQNGSAAEARFYDSKEEQYQYIAAQFANIDIREAMGRPVIVDTNKDRKAMTQAIREARRQETVFEMDSFESDAQVSRTAHLHSSIYEVGRQFIMHRNSDKFMRGEVLEVASNRQGKIFMRRHDGTELEFIPSKHGHDAQLGEFERVQIGPGDLLRVAAKWHKAGLRNGDRLHVRSIDQEGRAEVDVVDYDGKTIGQKSVNFAQRGISIRSGYASTVHGLQGASIDREGFYLAENTSRNAFMVGVTRFKNRFQLVGGARTQKQLESLVLRAQAAQIKEAALPEPKLDLARLRPQTLNAAWSTEPGQAKFMPFKSGRPTTQPEIAKFLGEAVDRFGRVKVSGSSEFLSKVKSLVSKSNIADAVEQEQDELTIKPMSSVGPRSRGLSL